MKVFFFPSSASPDPRPQALHEPLFMVASLAEKGAERAKTGLAHRGKYVP